MGSWHLQGRWSFRELRRTFGCDHKTVQRHLALLDAFLSGTSIPDMKSRMNSTGIESGDQLFQEAKRACDTIPVEVVDHAVESFRINTSE
jgi:hypothetical protein